MNDNDNPTVLGRITSEQISALLDTINTRGWDVYTLLLRKYLQLAIMDLKDESQRNRSLRAAQGFVAALDKVLLLPELIRDQMATEQPDTAQP